MRGRTVDYALCLEADRTEPTFSRMLTAIELETPGYLYINHTSSFEPVRYRPIVVSIETKIAGNENDSTTQLSIWKTPKNNAAFRCSFGNASATIDQYSRRRVVYKVGSSKGQQDGAIKFSLLLYLAN